MQLKYSPGKKALLMLQDGKIFEGKAAGKIGTTTGEICFNTGMTGYQEIFTDPSYTGQVIVMANAHIGNYGVHAEEVESSSIKISGMVCKKFNDGFSRAASKKSLQQYFDEQNIVAISDVDTRAIVRYIRDKGAMNCVISSEILDPAELKKILDKVPSMEGLELSSTVAAKESYTVGSPNASYRVAMMDYGLKQNIIRSLVARDCFVRVFPMKAQIEELLDFQPDGFMISNGPGDPAVMKEAVELMKKIIATDIPVFGICLGHQLLALAQGVRTYKMHAGHRGINHPVKNLISGKCEITSQNHGFSVNEEDIRKNADLEVTHINLNDNTIEGFRMKSKKIFSVQYHPEASPGPWDARYLFDQFAENMKVFKEAQRLVKA